MNARMKETVYSTARTMVAVKVSLNCIVVVVGNDLVLVMRGLLSSV